MFLSMPQFISNCAAVWPNLATTEQVVHYSTLFSSLFFFKTSTVFLGENPRPHLHLLLSWNLYLDVLSG